uniref:Uncharacterized protein n=1 Tax=Pelusios castaneus TaxID=367368 RepID=A0A8C8SSV9_9SAUR
ISPSPHMEALISGDLKPEDEEDNYYRSSTALEAVSLPSSLQPHCSPTDRSLILLLFASQASLQRLSAVTICSSPHSGTYERLKRSAGFLRSNWCIRS